MAETANSTDTMHTGLRNDVHCAITLTVRAGKEAEFDEVLARFVRRSMDYPGVTGVHLIRPAPETDSREYGVLRSFASEEASHAFYKSEIFAQYKAEAAELVEGEAVIRPLHGLEAFFRGSGGPPRRWKMAIVTWVGVFPTVFLLSKQVGARLHMLHPVVAMAIVTAIAVVTLTWFVMPLLTRLLRPWLHGH